MVRDNPRDPEGNNWHPPVLVQVRDTFVNTSATVDIAVTAAAGRPGAAIVRYYWDIGADGWDDSTLTPQYSCINPSGGPVVVVWAARDNEGAMARDTFVIIFNRPPSTPRVTVPASASGWVSYNFITDNGTLPLTMSAADPDLPYDTLTFTLFIGSSPGSLTQVYSGTNAVYNFLNVPPSTVIYWGLEAHDLFGDSTVDSGSFTSPPPFDILSEDFEGSYAGWTLTGDWQVGSPSYYGPSSAYHGTKCAGTVINGYYNNYTTSYLTSPTVTIPSTASQATLSYYEWYQTESYCDYMYVSISTNGGSTWTTLQSGYSGFNTSWTRRTFSLNSYIGYQVKLRFTFSTDGSVTYYGWYLDSLRIATQ